MRFLPFSSATRVARSSWLQAFSFCDYFVIDTNSVVSDLACSIYPLNYLSASSTGVLFRAAMRTVYYKLFSFLVHLIRRRPEELCQPPLTPPKKLAVWRLHMHCELLAE